MTSTIRRDLYLLRSAGSLGAPALIRVTENHSPLYGRLDFEAAAVFAATLFSSLEEALDIAAELNKASPKANIEVVPATLEYAWEVSDRDPGSGGQQ